MNSEDIKKRIWFAFSNYNYRLFNAYVFGSESDFIGVSKSGYVWEIEIKISRSDFQNDFKKTTSSGKNKHQYLNSDSNFKPNKFCFAVPEGLISLDEIPDYSGLIYVTKSDIKIVKQPKFLHKENLFENKTFLKRMLNKFYYRHTDLRRELELNEWNIKYRQQLFELNT